MKKFIISILVLIMLLPFNILCFAKDNQDKKVTINVYNWGEYISNGVDNALDVNKEFTKRTGIGVNYTTFQSNEELYAKLIGGSADYDVIIPSDYMISKLIENDMLRKINFDNVPNFSMIDENFKNLSYDPTNEYSIPYTWGTVGIFYNKNMVHLNEDEISWDILWDEKYKDDILMFDNPRDSFGISLIRLGKSVNSENEEDWLKAADELKKQKPRIQAYVMDQIFDKMANNEAALAPYYAGDAAILTKNNPNIGFVIPKEGTTEFVDAMCIPKTSMYPNEAEAYINFMCDTQIAKANSEYIGYSTPQKEAKKLLSDEIVNNKIFYPDEEVLQKAQIFKSLPDNISSLLDNSWVEIKTGGSSSGLVLIMVLLFFVILYFLAVFYKKRSKRKNL